MFPSMIAALLVAASTMPKPHSPHIAACGASPGVAAIVADPDATIAVSAPQSLVIVLRTVADGGYSWRLRTGAANPSEFDVPDATYSLPDVLFAHVDNPSAPPVLGGSSTSYFTFHVTTKKAATATLTFDEVGPGRDAKPERSRAFHVTIKASPTAC